MTYLAAAILAVAVLGEGSAATGAKLDEPTAPILDHFNGRGAEDPLDQWGNWAHSSIDGQGQTLELLGSGAGHNEGTSVASDSYRTQTLTGDAEVHATLASVPGNNYPLYLYLHLHEVGGPGWSGYRLRLERWVSSVADRIQIQRVSDGVAVNLANGTVPGDLQSGDGFLLRQSGGTLIASHRRSGVWTRLLTAPGGEYQSGMLGFGSDGDGVRWDDFGGSGDTTPEPPSPTLPSMPILDDFNRPDEDPLSQAGAWASASIAGSGQTLEVLGGRAGHNEGVSTPGDSYRGADLDGDAEVYATMTSTPDNNAPLYLYLHLGEVGGPGWDGYRVHIERWVSTVADTVAIQKFVDGQPTTLVSAGLAPDLQVGDVFLLRRVGGKLEVWRKNADVWTRRLSTFDATFTHGLLGLGCADDSCRWDDFGGGALGAPPPPSPPPPSDDPPVEQSRGICAGSGLHAIATSRCLSDPVNTLTGAFVTSSEDLSLPGTGVSFVWSRTYTSSDPTSGRLGPGWTDTYATSLLVDPDSNIHLHGDEGQVIAYARQPDGSFVGAPGALSTLSSVPGGYELVRRDQVAYRFDAQGRLLSTKDRNGQGLTFTYDATGLLTTVTDAAGRRATVAHNSSGLVSRVSVEDGRSVAYGYAEGRLTSVTDVRGKTWRYTYDAGGRLATIVDPLDHVEVDNAYGAEGRVVSQSDALGNTTTFVWDSSAEIATVTDANGNAWRDGYDDNVLVERIDPLGKATTFTYDDDLNTSGVSSPTGETTTMTYDPRGNLLSATAPASLGGVRRTFVYNARNDPAQVTDGRGAVTAYTYDADGNAERVVQDGTPIASYTYDEAGRVLTSTNGISKTTTFTYDTNGNVASETDPLGNTTTYTYDEAGRVLARVDPRGNAAGAAPGDFTWRWTYDAAGQVLTERDPLGGTTTHTYDDAGNELTITDATGRTTTSSYDAANRLVSTTGPDPDGSGALPAPVTTSTYDDVGNRLTETDVLGRTTTFTYDAANRLVSTTGPDPDGAGPLPAAVTTSTYDDNGNLASTVEPRGNVAGTDPIEYRTTFTYDAAGRLLTTTDPLANTTTNAYDPVGNLTSIRDANGHTTSFTHDAAGRITAVTGADGGVTRYTYDAAGNRLTRRDANGHVTTYGYDGAGRLVTETAPDPDGAGPRGPAVTTHAYDANGNLASIVDPNGNSTGTSGDGRTHFSYDAANRLVRIDYFDSTPDVTFAHDAVGNRVSMTDGSGSETRTYDGLNRLTSVTRGSNTFSYLYDAGGNLSRRTYPGGAAIAYAYDGLDRLATVASGGQTTSYGYDAASHLTQTTLPSANGHVETRVYDRAGRLTEIASRRGTTTLAHFVATLDSVGNPIQVVRTGALAQTQTYSYDPNDRIVSVCFQAGACPAAQDPFIRWTYDSVGNRVSEQRPTGTTAYNYDGADRLTQAGSTTYTYDENGNQLSAGSRTFMYDLANRVRTTRLGSTTTTYSYDGDGVRLQSSTGSSSSRKTNFLWDVNHPLPQIALERNGSGSLLRQYAYGERRVSMTSGSNTSYYHYDGLGSVAHMTSSSGARRWTWSYEPFGPTRTEQRSGSNAPLNFMKFTGEYLDPTGLYHLRVRQYDASLGRFLRPDPAEHGVSSPYIASYVYAANRPTVMVDPSGAVFRRADDDQEAAHFSASLVDWESPAARCLASMCGGRRPPRLVYPIPKRFPSRVVTFPSDPKYGFHPTKNLPGYPAIDFAAVRSTAVVAVENGRVREFASAIGGEALYFRGDSGVDYFYAHIRSKGVSRGERVRAGKVIAVIAPLSDLDHLHLGANANFGGRIVGRGRAGTDNLGDPGTQRARAIMRAISRAPRV